MGESLDSWRKRARKLFLPVQNSQNSCSLYVIINLIPQIRVPVLSFFFLDSFCKKPGARARDSRNGRMELVAVSCSAKSLPLPWIHLFTTFSILPLDNSLEEILNAKPLSRHGERFVSYILTAFWVLRLPAFSRQNRLSVRVILMGWSCLVCLML